MNTLLQILSNDERIIVLSEADEECIYTWNQSLTLQCWIRRGISYDDNDAGLDTWEEFGIQTLSTKPQDFKEARKAAQEWQHNMRDDR